MLSYYSYFIPAQLVWITDKFNDNKGLFNCCSVFLLLQLESPSTWGHSCPSEPADSALEEIPPHPEALSVRQLFCYSFRLQRFHSAVVDLSACVGRLIYFSVDRLKESEHGWSATGLCC